MTANPQLTPFPLLPSFVMALVRSLLCLVIASAGAQAQATVDTTRSFDYIIIGETMLVAGGSTKIETPLTTRTIQAAALGV